METTTRLHTDPIDPILQMQVAARQLIDDLHTNASQSADGRAVIMAAEAETRAANIPPFGTDRLAQAYEELIGTDKDLPHIDIIAGIAPSTQEIAARKAWAADRRAEAKSDAAFRAATPGAKFAAETGKPIEIKVGTPENAGNVPVQQGIGRTALQHVRS